MKLSKNELSILTKTLPKLRFSSVMKVSQFLNIDFEGLLNIKKAGKSLIAVEDEEDFSEEDIDLKLLQNPKLIRKIEELDEQKEKIKEKKEEENINSEKMEVGKSFAFSNFMDEVIKIAKKYQSDTESKLENKLSSFDNKNEIKNKLNELIKSNNDNIEVKKQVESLINEKSDDKELINLADSYVSLNRLIKGKMNLMIQNIVQKQGKKITDSRNITGISSMDEAVSLLGLAILMGKTEISPANSKRKIDIKTNKDSLSEYIKHNFGGSDNYVGAQSFISAIKQLSSQSAINFLNFMNKRKKYEKESLDVQVGDEEGGSKYDIMQSPKSISPEKAMMTKEIQSILEEAILDSIPNRNKDIANKLKETFEALEYKNFYKQVVPEHYWNSKKNGEFFKELWGEDNFDLFEKYIKKSDYIKNNLMNKLKDYSESPIMTSSRLSQQLLILAATNNNLKLASRVSALYPFVCAGNVEVYAEKNPQFSHNFFFKFEDNKVKIANVEDVDDYHINDAYDTAFKAVCETLIEQNKLKEL